MDQIIGTIVDSLFSVCVTLGIETRISFLEKNELHALILLFVQVPCRLFDVQRVKQLRSSAKFVIFHA